MQEILSWLSAAGAAAASISGIATAAVIFIRPLRERLLGFRQVREGQMCLLRSQIVRLYYRNLDQQSLRQYEFENLVCCYRAYRQLGGNSFVRRIYKEMQGWRVTR